MIIIFSVSDDYSTSRVINWLDAFKKEFIRINEDTSVRLISLDAAEFVISIDGRQVRSGEISRIWYRRGDIDFNRHFSSRLLRQYLSGEHEGIKAFFYQMLDKIDSINQFGTREMNKLRLLELCSQFSVTAPAFVVTGNKKILSGFMERHQHIISKPVDAPFTMFDEDQYAHLSYTAEVTAEDVLALPDEFVPTLFQQKVAKAYEIRAFYLKGEFYAMAIFSQGNAKTQVDYRNYDFSRPNRVTPYRFPVEYTAKLKLMLESIPLNCASFDVVVSADDQEYYFLDLNPIGQFGMVSDPCNYHLEKIIALNL
ncbi:grasp-with-spasm system ATP-grasp peptide maturase [Pedobacter sp. JY14-1]|uniref:grasp-with-spasm system ATP-grasp peptide maturase n=1 Tax=Pedobacter sp. JY14-1 TaxID=3034151 RepID=UPI0023E1AB5B|nr:grasp-with-spasm system ATP-grasp peptide maturase [Pedobacter sp. JY14-1]